MKNDIKRPQESFNDGNKPIVLVNVGMDDPMRGDSKAIIGIGRRVAELLDGQYLYCDKKTLGGVFRSVNRYNTALRNYLAEHGHPHILLGQCFDADITDYIEPSRWAELAGMEGLIAASDLVAHDLTQDVLNREAKAFEKEYPDIQGTLVAVLMGGKGGYDDRITQAVSKLMLIAEAYDQITFFVCPSRRTGTDYKKFFGELKAEFDGRSDDKVKVMGVPYATAKKGFNPYAGLIGKSDHAVIVGDSLSIVSEALAMGGPIFIDYEKINTFKGMQVSFDMLYRTGYVQYLEDMPGFTRFPKRDKPAIGVTEKISQEIVAAFHDKFGSGPS